MILTWNMVVLVLLSATVVLAQAPQDLAGHKPVKVIFDTDMDSDCDDPGALGVLHALADQGEVEILAVMLSALDPYAGPCSEAINTWYGRPEIPIGTAREPAPMYKSKYTKAVADASPHKLKLSSDAPDAVQLYREILAQQPDASVTVVTVGDMTNLAKLIADEDGRILVSQKVKLWVCMGGNFIGKPAKDDLKLGNNNFTLDAKATYAAITGWPTPIVFAGREVCSVPSGLRAGKRLIETPKENPVRIAYEAYFGGQVKDRHLADLVTVLYAVRGLKDYWDAEGPGRMDLKQDMTFEWRADATGQQAYLLKRNDADGEPNDRRIEREVEELLIAPPKAKAAKQE